MEILNKDEMLAIHNHRASQPSTFTAGAVVPADEESRSRRKKWTPKERDTAARAGDAKENLTYKIEEDLW